MRIHLDTDLGGDPDDLCALGMLLGLPEIEITGITTVLDRDGIRAGYLAYCLELAGRREIATAAGAVASLSTGRLADPVIDDERFWPHGLPRRPSSPGAPLDLLAASIDRGATIVAIGGCVNLALLEIARPGSLARVPVTVMGGWIDPPASGLPPWGPDMDWNIQWDPRAAEIVFNAASNLTLATLPATLLAHLRAAELPRLRAAGPLGALIARQSLAHAHDNGFAELARAHPALPGDLLNLHYDPVACAAALGWSELTVETMPLRPVRDGELLSFARDPAGKPTKVVTSVDGSAFTASWLAAIEAIG